MKVPYWLYKALLITAIGIFLVGIWTDFFLGFGSGAFFIGSMGAFTAIFFAMILLVIDKN